MDEANEVLGHGDLAVVAVQSGHDVLHVSLGPRHLESRQHDTNGILQTRTGTLQIIMIGYGITMVSQWICSIIARLIQYFVAGMELCKTTAALSLVKISSNHQPATKMILGMKSRL